MLSEVSVAMKGKVKTVVHTDPISQLNVRVAKRS